MKYFNAIAVGFLALLPNSFAGVLSETTNGVYVAISGCNMLNGVVSTNGSIGFDDVLIFATFCDSGNIELSYPLDPAYGVNLKMVGPNRQAVKRTKLGAQFGSKYDKLRAFNDTRVYPIQAWGHTRTILV